MIPRKEHPKPQFERKNWLNLNGEWQFEIDRGNSGKDRKLFDDSIALHSTITVPFCPQSILSGVGDKDFLSSVWYKREFTLDKTQINGRVFIHFGAVDYESEVYINGKSVGTHKGGYVSFKFDITDLVNPGKNTVCVNAVDDERSRHIPSGKQSTQYDSYGCFYTRTTGIWQTVWLEFTPEEYIKSVKYYPDAQNGALTVIADVCGKGEFSAVASFEGKPMGEISCHTDGEQITLTLPLKEKHLWEIGIGGLYDLTLKFEEDEVKSYFGLRSIAYKDRKFYLNGKSVFQRLVLDQGFYPDGIYTAPTDEALRSDIERGLACGFNGARLHEKIFEERFLYYADKMGYMVWGEYPNWGLDHTYSDAIYGILPEWLEEIERDFNHPSIVGWAPFNETWDIDYRKQFDELVSTVYLTTKAVDNTRPCIDVSGSFHVITDIFDDHNYIQNPDEFREYCKNLNDNCRHKNTCNRPQDYDGKVPFFMSEYGGVSWNISSDNWGYGNAPKTPEEYFYRVKGLTDVLLDNPNVCGFCYTQLYDVELEQNGLYTYERQPKFEPARYKEIFSRKAKVEE